MSDCIDKNIEHGYEKILGRKPDVAGAASYRNQMLHGGLSLQAFYAKLAGSGEFLRKNPDLCGGSPPDPDPDPGPDPDPDPLPPPAEGAIKSLMLSSNHRGFTLDGRPWTNMSHGAIVTAVPAEKRKRTWQDDLHLQVSEGEEHGRFWYFLSGDTPNTDTPWQYVGGKFDLTRWNEAFWAEKRAVMKACGDARIVLDIYMFDRGTGGSVQDFKAHPFCPDNNVNNLKDELSGPNDFYALKPKTTKLQEIYIQKWLSEMGPYPGCMVEIDNEYRGDNKAWPRRMAQIIKSAAPTRIVIHSSLGSDLEAAYSDPNIDVVSKHYGNEGGDPRVYHDYLVQHWSKGKVVYFGEFANGFTDKAKLKAICEEIVKNGGHGHVEDSSDMADGYGATANARSIAALASPPYYEVGPSGSTGPCPSERWRGVSFYNAVHAGHVWIGHEACSEQNKWSGFPAGTHIAFDSTPQAGQNQPIPPGCPVQIPTKWTCVPSSGGKVTTDDFGMQTTFAKSGQYTVTAKGDAGSKSLLVRIA